MQKEYALSIYLDTRRSKANGLFPVKLRLFTPSPRKQKLYSTSFDFSEKDFDKIWNTVKPRNEYKDIRRKLQEIENHAEQIASQLSPFTLEQFEKRLFRNEGDGLRVGFHYEQQIAEFKKRDQISTASTYELSEKSIVRFLNSRGKKYQGLVFQDITKEWLKDYEYFMVNTESKSLTTVSMYLRALKAIFNKALDEKEIHKDIYPFGRKKYQIPAVSNVKKALNKAELKRLFQSVPEKEEQIKAKDFWFFSYACNGMNIKDIAELRFKDIEGGKFEFVRAKTKLTAKSRQKSITVYLNSFTHGIIEKYANQNSDPLEFVFPILKKGDSATEQRKKIQNFTRFINQHIKKLCIELELPSDISTYWARHSFATIAIRNGASMEFIQESLGHGNLKTTQVYFEGFDSETKREFSEQLLNELV